MDDLCGYFFIHLLTRDDRYSEILDYHNIDQTGLDVGQVPPEPVDPTAPVV